MIRLIIFDWDDVFTIGSTEGYIKCYHETLQELGIKLDPEEERKRILSRWSKPAREELRVLLKENLKLLDRACEIYNEKLFGDIFTKSLEKIKGSTDLVKRLRKKYTLAIATGIHPKLLREKIMPMMGFEWHDFSEIISSYDVEDVKKTKPHPFMAEQILSRLRIDKTEAVLVGDSRVDVMMALGAGITPVVVLTGHLSKKEADNMGVKFIIDNVTKLESVLSEIDS